MHQNSKLGIIRIGYIVKLKVESHRELSKLDWLPRGSIQHEIATLERDALHDITLEQQQNNSTTIRNNTLLSCFQNHCRHPQDQKQTQVFLKVEDKFLPALT